MFNIGLSRSIQSDAVLEAIATMDRVVWLGLAVAVSDSQADS